MTVEEGGEMNPVADDGIEFTVDDWFISPLPDLGNDEEPDHAEVGNPLHVGGVASPSSSDSALT